MLLFVLNIHKRYLFCGGLYCYRLAPVIRRLTWSKHGRAWNGFGKRA